MWCPCGEVREEGDADLVVELGELGEIVARLGLHHALRDAGEVRERHLRGKGMEETGSRGPDGRSVAVHKDRAVCPNRRLRPCRRVWMMAVGDGAMEARRRSPRITTDRIVEVERPGCRQESAGADHRWRGGRSTGECHGRRGAWAEVRDGCRQPDSFALNGGKQPDFGCARQDTKMAIESACLV